MDLYEIVDQVAALVQQRGQVTYRSLKRQFALNDDYFEDLKAELLYTHPEVVDDEERGFKWAGAASVPHATVPVAGAQSPSSPNPQAPAAYTPPHLAERIRAEQAVLEARGGTDGERKTITALFADIQDSTALIEDLDPEAARRLIDPVLQLMMDAVHRYEGFVVQPTGDGIFALFGAPLAHEDHPQRALFAALLMQAESKRYAEQLRREQGLNLQIRVGVNTGEVVLRSIRKDDLHTDYTPVGHSIHLAARLESLASGGGIVISEGIYKLVEGYFESKALGEAKVKGVTEPIAIYEVLGVGPLRTRLQVSARRGFTRFVGRQSELAQMQKALEQATAGHGQIVGVMGEPGLGKSRLFYEFKLTAQSGCLVLEAFSVSYGKASPYLPLLELLKSYFQIVAHDEERARREKVLGKVLGLDRTLDDTLPYLFTLLGIEDPTASLQQMDPQIRRRRLFEALKRLFLRESLKQPVILIFEDLHWIDSETQGFLDILSESVASARLLLLVNYRPEYRQEWGQKTYYTQLRLAPFGKAEAEEFLEALLGVAPVATVGVASGRSGGVPPPPLSALKQLILEKTEGTPFFMEEIVQELVEQGVLQQDSSVGWVATHPTPALHLPPTVQGVLAARIDRLAVDEKECLQQLAVIGREFPLSLLRHVLPQPEEKLYRLLASLQRKEFLYEQPAFPEVEYSFKHALTQEVAYGTVLQERRKALHERTAQAIEALYGERVEDHYSDLAHHYSRSGNTEKAVEYLHLAGQQAVQRSANEEAITHLTTALELLRMLPDTRARAQQELRLHLTLGMPLLYTRGFSSPEVGATYTRARELCQQVGETRQLFSVLHGLRTVHQVRGELLAARELGEQLLDLAQKEQDPAMLVEAHWALGYTLFHLGELSTAQAHMEQSLSFYDSQRHRSPVFLDGREPGIIGLLLAARVLWHLGYPDQALQKSEAACTLAQELSRPFNLAAARNFTAMTHQFRRERLLTQEWAEAGITLAREHGFPQWVGHGAILQGWALAEQGQSEEGISQLRQGLATQEAVEAGLFHSYFLVLLAEAYGKAGQAEDGLAALAEALTVVDQSGERFYEAELYRLKGQLTLQKFQVSSSRFQVPDSPKSEVRGPESEAEECFWKAMEIARRQQAKSLELRAVMSLSRLWQQQGKQKEAHALLAKIYGWFTEGFDTKDLQEAKALLAELTEDR
ncbi:MAG: AAA family ATPase [Deltaproteobacteria bacterium]|nr:AAA family ATPase [Deltaproteobacteria bacterium]